MDPFAIVCVIVLCDLESIDLAATLEGRGEGIRIKFICFFFEYVNNVLKEKTLFHQEKSRSLL